MIWVSDVESWNSFSPEQWLHWLTVWCRHQIWPYGCNAEPPEGLQTACRVSKDWHWQGHCTNDFSVVNRTPTNFGSVAQRQRWWTNWRKRSNFKTKWIEKKRCGIVRMQGFCVCVRVFVCLFFLPKSEKTKWNMVEVRNSCSGDRTQPSPTTFNLEISS